ncbi:MAG: aminoacyl-tRNA hydrolase [Fimbriimonadaceae bacterium]|nr:aminoacyl-tRNA hydrolase [Fimbriimonadaceae bacterium]
MFRRKQRPDNPPTHMIVGLGNPGAEYARTRHNVGFDVIEALAAEHKVKVRESASRALFGCGEVQGVRVALVKPLTFMNISGEAVASLARKWGIAPVHILVIADDLDLPTGTFRMRPGGGAGGHNGHRSIISKLGTNEYPRIRIGIGKGEDETISHVLSKFTPDERTDIDLAIKRAASASESWLANGIDQAMNKFNAT